MNYLDVISFYVVEYEVKDSRSVKVHGEILINTQILIYLLRTRFNLTFREIGEVTLISRQCANIYYYIILSSRYYRDVADTRWKELFDAREIHQN